MSGVFKVTKLVWESGVVTANAYSPAFSMNDFTGLFSVTVQTGTLTGSVVLQGSDTESGTFVTLTDSGGSNIVLASPAGATATFVQTVDAVFAPWCRVAYVDTSGSGEIDVTVTLVRQS